MKAWEIEKLFNEEIREKRKTGNGVFSRRGKGVKHGISGALKTPYYYLKTKERNALNGEVETSNMYSSILNWNEWNMKDKETQKMLLTKWREIYPNGKIMAELGNGRHKPFNSQSFADIVNGLGCPAKLRGGSEPKKLRQAKQTKVVAITQSPEKKPSLIETIEQQQEPIKLITTGLHLEYNGDYDSEQIGKILTKLQLIVDGEENKFNLSISLIERA